jgi:hypothetical protein
VTKGFGCLPLHEDLMKDHWGKRVNAPLVPPFMWLFYKECVYDVIQEQKASVSAFHCGCTEKGKCSSKQCVCFKANVVCGAHCKCAGKGWCKNV